MCEEASIMMRFIVIGHQICNMVYRDSEHNDFGFDRCEGFLDSCNIWQWCLHTWNDQQVLKIRLI